MALPRDASARYYFRGKRQGNDVIVMSYPDASEEYRTELKQFVGISQSLSNAGLKVAECYDLNEAECYGVFEDLGRASFGDCLRQNLVDQRSLYKKATQALIDMREVSDVQTLPLYKDTRIYVNRRQLIDYYMAFAKEERPDEAMVQEFQSVWDEIELSLPPCPQGFVHGDYHLENLIYSENEENVRQCALIDYQDAFYGPLPYDLLNLLEDARATVPEQIREDMMSLYIEGLPESEREAFKGWFRVLAAQFHGRVIGLFIKLAAEQGRDGYLIHIPRLQDYLKKSLEDPVLAPLKVWFDKVGLDFQPINDLDGNHIRTVFEGMGY